MYLIVLYIDFNIEKKKHVEQTFFICPRHLLQQCTKFQWKYVTGTVCRLPP